MVDAECYAVHNDHLGTPQRMRGSAQMVVWAADYLPFGEAQVGVGLRRVIVFRGSILVVRVGCIITIIGIMIRR